MAAWMLAKACCAAKVSPAFVRCTLLRAGDSEGARGGGAGQAKSAKASERARTI